MASPPSPNALAVVVGASRGLGLATALELAAVGWTVLATVRGESIPAELEGRAGIEVATGAMFLFSFGRASGRGIDVSLDGCGPLLSDHVADRQVTLVILVAAIMAVDSLEAVDFPAALHQFNVNALGPLRAVTALRHRLAPGARVALVSSKMGSLGRMAAAPPGGLVGYRLSKAAANAGALALAAGLAPDGVAVGILHPGTIKTDMYDYFHGTAPPATPTGAASPAADHRDHSVSALGGPVAPDDAARRLLERVWEIDLESTGRFVDEEGAALPY